MTYNFEAIIPFLLDWFDYNARILAWRENPKPYYVWISEIMLQQTRVEAVKGYFDRFTAALPDVKALAEVEEEKLLKLWEGLGYYNRARNLQKAAKKIMEEYQGEIPGEYEKLLTLPGIGTYTAGAIASIAFQVPVPVVDGNVLRVTKRISCSFDDITKDSVKKELWQDLYDIMPSDRPGDFNQSLMELGATVCLPNGKPLCDKCPVMHLCKAFKEDKIMQIPVKPQKKKRRIEERTIFLIEYQDRFIIHKRPKTGLLAGLWELPGIDAKQEAQQMTGQLKDMGIELAQIMPLGEAKHIFSHVEWHMIGYHIAASKLDLLRMKEQEYVLAKKEEIDDKYSIPNAFSAYVKHIN